MLMGAALLPLAVLSYVQTLAAENVADSRIRAAILGETLLAAGPQVDLLMQAAGAAATLAAALPQVVDSAEDCSALVRRVAAASKGRYSFVGFIPTDGKIRCTSADQPYDLGRSKWLADLLADPKERLTVNRRGGISGTSVLNLTLPVFGSEGNLIGFSSVSMSHSAIVAQGLERQQGREAPLSLMTFNDSGTILTSTVGLDGASALIPAFVDLTEFVGQPGQSLIGVTQSGERRAFAVVPLSPGKLYLLGSWPADKIDTGDFTSGFPAPTFPALMWAASLLVAWLAAEGQVLRHVRALRDSITAFAGGDRKVKPLNNKHAAAELRDVGEAYESMTAAILHDEAQLENTIHQKEVLLREVHHRVKNNLQLIASILNMQLRTTRSEETREAMKTVQDRVLSLATIHRELYQTSGLTDIRADELLPRIARHILRIGTLPERPFDLDLKIDDLRLTPDQAVPLALFLTEGLTNVIKHNWHGNAVRAKISLHFLRLRGGDVELRLSNDLPDQAAWAGKEGGKPGFGTKLLSAFAQQLEGALTQSADGGRYLLTLRFHPCPLDQAELRKNAENPGKDAVS